MIDWKHLEPLPSKRRNSDDRERLAKASFAKKAAKHKGRAHFYAWQKRKAKADSAKATRDLVHKREAKITSHIEMVRAYWRGEIDEHPSL